MPGGRTERLTAAGNNACAQKSDKMLRARYNLWMARGFRCAATRKVAMQSHGG